MIQIDLSSEVPIYLQLRNQIILAIARGELKTGDALPTVRQLAEDIGVNPMTVSKTYNELKNQGYLETNLRQGTLVRRKVERTKKQEERLHAELELLLAEARLSGYDEKELLDTTKNILKRYRG